ncbi:MAG: glycosyltransferase [Gemmatimonadales bacterium]|nr:MAG: glycosyltransferase [Gemmatimonadales bacterium]
MVPGPVGQRTGGYLYDARMRDEFLRRGWEMPVHELPGRFPAADPAARQSMARTLSALPTGSRVLLDGLALGGLPCEAAVQARRLRLVALVHHPLAHEAGLPAHLRLRFGLTEREAVRHCMGVVVTSPFTAERVQALGVPPERIRVAPPGTEPAPLASAPLRAPAFGNEAQGPMHLVCVGSLAPRKGQDILVEAAARMEASGWTLTLVGSLERNPAFAREVVRRIRELGMEDRIRVSGELDHEALERLYRQTTLLVVPSLYEGYGMVVTEAVARGIPVLATDGGALPHTLPAGSGVVVPAGDAAALGRALDQLLEAHGARSDHPGAARWRALVEEARHCSDRLLDWPEAASVLAEALASLDSMEGARTSAMPFAPEPPHASGSAHSPDPSRAQASPDPADATFDADWLSLREPVDHRSRAEGLLPDLVDWWRTRMAHRIVDLGSGTGSNLRYLAPRLPGSQRWTLVDHDPDLLARVRRPTPSGTFHIRSLDPVVADLAGRGLESVARADLVTASALLDLVSREWLGRLVQACLEAGAAALFALSYDGTVRWSRAAGTLDTDGGDVEGGTRVSDRWILDAVNRHQHRDKGTGGALGPRAAEEAARLFRGAGYRCRLLPTPWVLGSADASLVGELVDGWARAATEVAPGRADAIRRWARLRTKQVAAGEVQVSVGHLDLLALPPEAG